MGSHRAEPGSSSAPTPTSATPQTYVGKRIARPAVEAAPAPLTTSDTGEWKLDPSAIVDTSTFYFGDVDVTSEIPVVPAGGRRKAPGRRVAPRRHGVRGLPSAPVLLGVATMALAVGGALTTTGTTLASHQTRGLQGASAMSGSSAVGIVDAARDTQSLSRSSDRQALQQASGETVSTASSTDIEHHDAALGKLARLAEHQATKLNNNRWVLPIEPGVYHLTARFGDVSGLWATVHTGLDFACGIGTPIHAVYSGTITFAGWDGPYGNKTVETLPDGTEIWYGHQTTEYVHVGETVTRDEVIGTVGATGNVTGPHVHIEVRPGGGDPVDPYPAFVAHGVTP